MSKFFSRWSDGSCRCPLCYDGRSCEGGAGKQEQKRRNGRSQRREDEAAFQSFLIMQVNSTTRSRISANIHVVITCGVRFTEPTRMPPRDHHSSEMPAGWKHDTGRRMQDVEHCMAHMDLPTSKKHGIRVHKSARLARHGRVVVPARTRLTCAYALMGRQTGHGLS